MALTCEDWVSSSPPYAEFKRDKAAQVRSKYKSNPIFQSATIIHGTVAMPVDLGTYVQWLALKENAVPVVISEYSVRSRHQSGETQRFKA